MSYILDALQRADAERERGGVPGLHARQVVATALPQSAATRWGFWWLVTAIVAMAILAGGFWLTRAPAVATAPPIVDTLAPREVVVALSAPRPTPVPAPIAAPVVTAPVTLTASSALDSPLAKVRPVSPQLPVVQTPMVTAKPAPSVAASSHAITAPPAIAVPWFADLPADLRQHIPKLTITGTVYSENPAQRLLVVNGQVLTQGSEVAPELSLAEIHPTNSDFIFRGTRFRVAH